MARWLLNLHIAGVVVFLVGTVLLWPASATQAAQAQPLVWSEPIRVSEGVTQKVDWFPRVAADNLGNVHIVWNLTNYDDDKGHNAPDPDAIGQLEYTRWNGRSWTPQTDVGLIWYGYALRNAIAADNRNGVHMTYKGWGTNEEPLDPHAVQDIWYTSADSPQPQGVYDWDPPVKVSGGNPSYFSDLTVDSHGVIHVIWTEGDTQGVYALYYAHSSDSGRTWSQRVILSQDDAVWWYRAHLSVDARDGLHVVWEAMPDPSTKGLAFGVTRAADYAQSLDGGYSWTQHEFAGALRDNHTAMAPGPQQPVVGVDKNGTIVFVYREYGTNRIVYRTSLDGVRWTAPKSLPGVTKGVERPYDVYDTATDSAGIIHLVGIGYPNGSADMAVLHWSWSGDSWSQPEVIATPPPFPEYPRIAIGNGNQLHIVWFGGDIDSVSRTPVGIWYSTAEADAPSTFGHIAPLNPAAPALGQGLSGAAAPTRTPIPAALPTPVMLAAADHDSASSQPGDLRSQPVLPIAASVAVASIVLAVVLFARRLVLR